ncbi:hypothetical protein [Brevundimonas sp.]|uniref:hypothetical protein n=1 Tax=Brevundimonas sp. TaxID=1871086 RepID=UPI0025DE2A90|nr:hypothetical protein [Brevundimonas sp.]
MKRFLYLWLLTGLSRVGHVPGRVWMVGRMDQRSNGGLQPTREYLAATCAELAEVARDIGDRRLGHLLDLAAAFAEMRPETIRDEGPRPSL